MSYRVYVLQNRERKFYIGLSDNVARRVEQHNRGESKWTPRKGHWVDMGKRRLVVFEARKLEIRLKRQKGGH